MGEAFAETNAVEQARGAGSSGFGSAAFRRVLCRNLRPSRFRQGGNENIFQYAALRQKIMRLENEADLPVSDCGQVKLAELVQVLAVEQDLTVGGPIQRADDVQ